MLFDHVNLPVSNIEASAQFYTGILKLWNLQVLVKEPDVIGFGREHWEFGIVLDTGNISRIHLALAADSEALVQKFHETALLNGATCNGRPGFRPEYGSSYYAAYVVDSDGHNIEAVCRKRL